MTTPGSLRAVQMWMAAAQIDRLVERAALDAEHVPARALVPQPGAADRAELAVERPAAVGLPRPGPDLAPLQVEMGLGHRDRDAEGRGRLLLALAAVADIDRPRARRRWSRRQRRTGSGRSAASSGMALAPDLARRVPLVPQQRHQPAVAPALAVGQRGRRAAARGAPARPARSPARPSRRGAASRGTGARRSAGSARHSRARRRAR